MAVMSLHGRIDYIADITENQEEFVVCLIMEMVFIERNQRTELIVR